MYVVMDMKTYKHVLSFYVYKFYMIHQVEKREAIVMNLSEIVQ